MKKHAKLFSVERMSKALGVSKSGYYHWLNNPISKRKAEDMRLLALIRSIFIMSNSSYGCVRITDELRIEQGEKVSRKRVSRIMKENNMFCKGRKKRFPMTTDSNHNFRISPNLLKQNFKVERFNQVWVSDITYIKSAQGWTYLTVILDLFDRKVVGWSTSKQMDTASTIGKAWAMALLNRPISHALIFHSDRGVQYASNEFRNLLKLNPHVSQSMSRTGNCYDNAVAESFFKSLKVEWIYPYYFNTFKEAELAVFEYIEAWYNRRRRHSHLGGLNMIEFENIYQSKLAA